MGSDRLRQPLPIVIVHMAVASLHITAALAAGAQFGTGFRTGLATVLLLAPTLAVLGALAGQSRWCAAWLLLSYLGMAGLTLYAQLGLGTLATLLQSGASPWKYGYFGSAMALPLLQIAGIAEAVGLLLQRPERAVGHRQIDQVE